MIELDRVALGFARAGIVGGLLFATAPAQAAPPIISVWFRGTDGCPSGEAFLAQLSEHAVEGRLASVGDRIDFVVTLGRKDGESSATLERQSAQGTVALRELHGASCDAVAEALALTLALTVDPDAAPGPAEVQPETAAPAAPLALAPVASAPSAAPPEPPHPEGPEPTADHADASRHGAPPKALRWLIGAQGVVESVVSGAPLWGGAIFGELRATSGLMPSARLSLVGGVVNNAIPNVQMNLVAGRLEGCPIFVGATIAAGACAGLDLGRLGASSSANGGRSDASFWSALWGLARLRLQPPRSALSAEIQGGISAALTRYRITGDVPPRTLAETRPVGVGLAAGGAVSFP